MKFIFLIFIFLVNIEVKASQNDYNIANDTGANFRADLNSALAAIVSQNSGTTAPATTYAYQFWVDTSSGAILKMRNGANNAWIVVGDMSQIGLGLLARTGGTLTGELILNSTDDLKIPAGTTAQRPGSPTVGMIRYNTTVGYFEAYVAGGWHLFSNGNTSFSIANNQSTVADITGLNLDTAVGNSFVVAVEVMRKTDSAGQVRKTGQVRYHYNTTAAAWDAPIAELSGVGDDGMEFSTPVVTSGTTFVAKYKSSNISGANYSGTLKFSIKNVY